MKFVPDDWLKQLKNAYPKRAIGCNYEWPKAHKLIQERMREGHSFDDILAGTKNYCLASKQCGNYGTPFVKQASTFFGPGLHFLDEFEVGEEWVPKTPEVVTEKMKKEDQQKWVEDMHRLGHGGSAKSAKS